MTCDIILAGVGGQGVLSLATVIAQAAATTGLKVRQSEVHGMAQRGGSVLAHLRISDQAVVSDLIPRGRADLILSMEPLEALRYLDFLKPEGAVVSSVETIKNMPSYPDEAEVLSVLQKLPKVRLLATAELARLAGNPKSANLVLVGAASAFIPLAANAFVQAVADIFGHKGTEVIKLNLQAFELGKTATHEGHNVSSTGLRF